MAIPSLTNLCIRKIMDDHSLTQLCVRYFIDNQLDADHLPIGLKKLINFEKKYGAWLPIHREKKDQIDRSYLAPKTLEDLKTSASFVNEDLFLKEKYNFVKKIRCPIVRTVSDFIKNKFIGAYCIPHDWDKIRDNLIIRYHIPYSWEPSPRGGMTVKICKLIDKGVL